MTRLTLSSSELGSAAIKAKGAQSHAWEIEYQVKQLCFNQRDRFKE